jgi:hypothetical protein
MRHREEQTSIYQEATQISESSESKAAMTTPHLDNPSDGRLEYLMAGTLRWPYLNHSFQFKHTLHLSVRNIAMHASDSSAEF